MYTRKFRSFRLLIRSFGKQLAWYGPYVTAVYIAYEYFKLDFLDIKMSIATVLGFAVALLMGFRTSAAYDRWWEARKIWGGIVNDSRTLVRQVLGFSIGKGAETEIEKMAHYQIAWCYALKRSLRGQDPLKEVKGYLSAEEIERIRNKNNKPNEILKLMNELLAELQGAGKIDAYQMVSIDQTIKHLCDHMGKAERINNTVFPVQYRSYTHRGIIFFTLMLPYGMLYSTGPFVILICILVSFFFYMLENIAATLQDPFEDRATDIPMSALCRTIEINLLELIGSEDAPEPMKPDEKGVLM